MADMILFIGQSNMQGQTGELPSPNEPAYRSVEYRMITDSFRPLIHPTGENLAPDGSEGPGTIQTDTLRAASEGKGSLIPFFCDAYAKAAERDVVAVVTAKGNTTLSYWQKGGEAYNLILMKFRAAKARYTGEIGHCYCVFLQGESDAIERRTQVQYEELLSRFIADLKADLGIETFGVIRIARFTEDERDFEILRAQEAVCARGEGLLLTRVTGTLLKDKARYQSYANNHYNNAAMAIIGATAGANLAAHASGDSFDPGEEPYGEDIK